MLHQKWMTFTTNRTDKSRLWSAGNFEYEQKWKERKNLIRNHELAILIISVGFLRAKQRIRKLRNNINKTLAQVRSSVERMNGRSAN